MKRVKILSKLMASITYCYLTLPILIFVIGWLRWYWALTFGCCIVLGMVLCIKNDNIDYSVLFKKNNAFRIAIAFFMIVIWVFLSGIGGVFFQNFDHGARTAIYRVLVEYDWPVLSKEEPVGLIYYIGFWLPSAVVGKLFGFQTGYKFQILWSVIGIFIVYSLICVMRKKVSIWPLVLVIMFSGLDIVGVLLLYKPQAFNWILHIEHWSRVAQYSSMTTQLFWVFNQAIPAWIATILIYVGKNKRNMLFILGTIFISSTFPFVGLIPFVIYYLFYHFKFKKEYILEIFSVSNIIGVCVVGGISFIYLIGNISSGSVGSATGMQKSLDMQIFLLVIFAILEYGIYMLILWTEKKNDLVYYIVLAMLVLCPIIKVGGEKDFCMRASIPALFILMLFCIEFLESWREKHCRKTKVILILLLCIGAITPVLEINRSVVNTHNSICAGEPVTDAGWSVEKELMKVNNFVGNIEGNFFYRYFSK